MEHWFDGSVVFVTGGGDGIGRATALLFARRGARLAVTDVQAETAAATVELIKGEGGEAIAFACDVADADAVKRGIAQTVAHFGRLDSAFNNAGINMANDGEWGEETFRRMVDVNLIGTMTCIREEVTQMLRTGGGTIVNTASIMALIGSEMISQPAYTATKHGIVGLTKTAALQYAKRNIRVNALCPGTTLTTMVRSVIDYSAEARKAVEASAPMNRLATVEEMAEAAVWLASSKSSFVTGHALVVDGGALAQ